MKQSYPSLPALQIAEKVNEQLRSHNVLVITAPPGAGKSTLLPLTMLEGLTDGGKILLLEPRRLAAKQIAERLASLLGESVGQTVGYRIRFEKKVSEKTRIEVLTEGILTRWLVQDPTLEGVSILIFDEFHERSLHSEVALALARESQQLIRPDLKLVLMSATLEVGPLCQALHAPLVESEGKMFPVKVIHAEECSPREIAEQMASTIRQAHREQDGDILAFLPGQGEIQKCQELLGDSLGETVIYPLYGLLPFEQQRKAILPSLEHQRKVVLATSIAETSLTIEGVRVAIDSGYSRTLVFDPRNGLSHLETTRITLDRAIQRTGRAGRLCEGICYRLWSLATEHRMEPARKPEILETDLASMVLEIAAWGESDVLALPWLTPPPIGKVASATLLLQELGALNEQKQITPLGKKMANLPCHPRISRMLLTGQTKESQALAADIAAILEERDPMADSEANTSIYDRIAVLRGNRAKKTGSRWFRICQMAQEYRKLVQAPEINSLPSPDEIGILIASAYPERIAKSQDALGKYKMAGGGFAQLERADELSSQDWLAIATLQAQSGKIFLAEKIASEDLAGLAQTRDHLSWDSQKGQLIAQQERHIGSLVLESKPLSLNDTLREQASAILCLAVQKEGLSLLDFTDKVKQLQQRISTVAGWHPELELPSVTTEDLIQRTPEWLPLYLDNNGKLRTSASELKKIDLTQVIWGLLTYEQQQAADLLAPSHLTVPTGSKIRIDYRPGAEAPVVSVRLQECFGLTETPCVNQGKQPVLMELLSPGFKPVQLTQNLKSFWQGTYFEVRKELRRRYPKHYWPENPLEAEATRGVKKRVP